MKTLCSGCNAELDPSTTLCPICLRPRSSKEIARGLEDQNPALRLRRILLKSSTYKMAAGSALLFVALYLLTKPGPPLPEPPPEPEHVSAPKTSEPPASAREIQALKASLDQALARKAKRKETPAAWTIRGKVYDLISLKPVSGAQIVFQDKEGDGEFKTRTNARGLYAVRLPPLKSGGYAVSIRHRNYSGTYLEEDKPAYSDQGRRRREEALQNLRHSAVLHIPILLSGSQSSLEYNLVLFSR